MSTEEQRVDVTINIRQSLYDHLKQYSEKNLCVPHVPDMIKFILMGWENKIYGPTSSSSSS